MSEEALQKIGIPTAIAFHKSAARTGLTAIPPLADPTQYSIVGTNYASMGFKGKVSYVAFRTAAIANYVNSRFRSTLMRDYISAYQGIDQTRQLIGKSDWFQVDVPVKLNGQLEAQNDNGGNAQVEGVYALMNDVPFKIHNAPPPDAYPVLATATTALVANVWSDPGTVTWSKTFDPEKRYQIVGAMGHSATGYLARLVYKTHNRRPGFLIGDTAQLQAPIYYNMGSFLGNNPPNLEHLASATDGDVYNTFWIRNM